MIVRTSLYLITMFLKSKTLQSIQVRQLYQLNKDEKFKIEFMLNDEWEVKVLNVDICVLNNCNRMFLNN